ncbi:transmembrane protein, putative (macronuclear) [Tetrahymena thermophila SB210]|uniref:Transmembrane protein, putative n=1 Tax=Tetrahymena thermophila (strain SB210) TaxID=312017 RepID=W7X551_TETTS|nr:transmembrane protein, putative [Tetrahymena thermophila SB210]EWS71503.1 transmembrane protein, putative [Tetrahymena thermophila SB210]|eukprot:XP_012655962.1 transmembrane protein, putative [Tetrahymena thermophila SB210]
MIYFFFNIKKANCINLSNLTLSLQSNQIGAEQKNRIEILAHINALRIHLKINYILFYFIFFSLQFFIYFSLYYYVFIKCFYFFFFILYALHMNLRNFIFYSLMEIKLVQLVHQAQVVLQQIALISQI